MMKKVLLLMLVVLLLVGCEQKKTENYSTENLNENVDIVELEEEKDSDTLIEQDVIADTSEIAIFNFLDDGTFWGMETNEINEEYIINADIYGNVISRIFYNRDEWGGYVRYGMDSTTLIIEGSEKDQIVDISMNEDITNRYTGDYDEICDYIIETNGNIVFVCKKTVETFEETYECFKLVDSFGNSLFEISLDSDTLLNEYGITKTDSSSEMKRFADNMYYIAYIGGKYNFDNLNSLIIDLNRNKVIPVPFPNSNGRIYCSSDGNYTVVYVPQYGKIRVNNDTGEVEGFPNEDYDPVGDLSEEKFFASGHWNGNSNEVVVLDTQGNVVIDLNNYEKPVSTMYPFTEGVALIQFGNEYVTFIDSEGNFMFEPLKGSIKQFYSEQCIAVIRTSDDGEVYSIDKNGNKETLELPGSGNIFYVEYEGNRYWIEDGKGGLHVCEKE